MASQDAKKTRSQRKASANGKQNGVAKGATASENDEEETDYVTEEEELRLVQRYCEQIRMTCDHFKWPVNIKVRPNQASTSHRT